MRKRKSEQRYKIEITIIAKPGVRRLARLSNLFNSNRVGCCGFDDFGLYAVFYFWIYGKKPSPDEGQIMKRRILKYMSRPVSGSGNQTSGPRREGLSAFYNSPAWDQPMPRVVQEISPKRKGRW